MLSFSAFSQEEEKEVKAHGAVSGKLYANFHTGGTSGAWNSEFEMTRAYFGYKYTLDKNFGAVVMLDIGSADDLKVAGNTIKRYAFFKNAYMSYKSDGLTMKFGIAGTYTMGLHDKFWGYRYISKPFLNKYKFGSTADLGIFADYKIDDNFSADVSFANGEGYNNVQLDNFFKTSVGATYVSNGLTVRGYYDFVNSVVIESTLAGFVGYTMKDKVKFAAELGYRINDGATTDKNKLAYSVLAVANINKKMKVFGRFDHIQSSTLPTLAIGWNTAMDGNKIIAGFEFIPTKNVNLALNYQGNMYSNTAINRQSFIFLNAQLAF